MSVHAAIKTLNGVMGPCCLLARAGALGTAVMVTVVVAPWIVTVGSVTVSTVVKTLVTVLDSQRVEEVVPSKTHVFVVSVLVACTFVIPI